MVEMEKVKGLIGSLDLVPDLSAFDPNKTFRDNGIDSLGVMSILLAAEEKFGVKFSEDEASGIDTADALLDALNARGI